MSELYDFSIFENVHSWSIECNEHRIFYQKIEEYINDNEILKEQLSKEELKECIEKDSICEIRIYPITPIGFFHFCASTMIQCHEKVLKHVYEKGFK